MPLTAGQSLTHYEILGPLGAGGMGEVWRARDTRLDREVAIKVLPEHFVEDDERLGRFEREAKALAALNHPNIAQIFGVDQVDDTCFLVLELVPGETLSDRLDRGPVSVKDTLRIGRQMAEGLEAAHDAHIIHRDLKPANVRITPDGVVKLLDFGLAKASVRDPESGETITQDSDSLAITGEGRVLGTPTYMSPEQARGKRLDRRTDIWAFGCVLFEMLSGQRPFTGETVTDVLGAIVHKDPEWDLLPPGVPARLRDLVRRCLVKDPRSRLRDAGDARIELERLESGPEEPLEVAAGGGRGRTGLLLLGLVLGVVLGGGGMWWSGQADRPERVTRRFALTPSRLNIGPSGRPWISPDGGRVLYRAGDALWIQELDELEPRRLAGTEGATHPFWSPDGEQLGFHADGRLWRMSRDGGPRVTVTELPRRPEGVGGFAWLADGTIAWTTAGDGDGILRAPASGGPPETWVEAADPIQDFHQMGPLPDGRGLLVVVHRKGGIGDEIAVIASGSSEVRTVYRTEGAPLWAPAWCSSGHVLFHRTLAAGGLWAVPFSLDELAVTGEPFFVAPDGVDGSVAADGTLVYALGSDQDVLQLIMLDRSGNVVREVGEPLRGEAFWPVLSPTGDRVAVSGREEGDAALWVYDTGTGARRRLDLRQQGFIGTGCWMPGGEELLIARGEPPDVVMELLAVDGSGRARRLGEGIWPEEVTPDGKTILIERLADGDHYELMPVDGGGEPTPFLEGPGDRDGVRLSPDGRHAVFWSDETGRDEVYLTRFPSGEGHWLVFEGTGRRPHWSRDGQEIVFAAGGRVVAVPVDTEGGVTFGAPVELFDTEDTAVQLGRGWDVTPDGEGIVALKAPSDASPPRIVVVENWTAGLGR